MIKALGWLIAIVGFVGVFACVASAHFYVMHHRVDPDTRADSHSKLMIGMAAAVCFFLVAILGVILLQISGAYGPR